MGYLLLGIFFLCVFGLYPLVIGVAGSLVARWMLKVKRASRWIIGGCVLGSWVVAAVLYAMNVGLLLGVGGWIYTLGIVLSGWLGLRLQGRRRGEGGVLGSRRV